MFVTILENQVLVRLSRRNLRQLEAMLDDYTRRSTCLARSDENGLSLVVQVQDDADHSGAKAMRPGLQTNRRAVERLCDLV